MAVRLKMWVIYIMELRVTLTVTGKVDMNTLCRITGL